MILFGQREDRESKKLREDFRYVFSSSEGKRVLTYILADLGYFDEAKDERSMALQGYARRLLEIMGILHEYNAYDFVNKLFELPVYDPQAQAGHYKDKEIKNE